MHIKHSLGTYLGFVYPLYPIQSNRLNIGQALYPFLKTFMRSTNHRPSRGDKLIGIFGFARVQRRHSLIIALFIFVSNRTCTRSATVRHEPGSLYCRVIGDRRTATPNFPRNRTTSPILVQAKIPSRLNKTLKPSFRLQTNE